MVRQPTESDHGDGVDRLGEGETGRGEVRNWTSPCLLVSRSPSLVRVLQRNVGTRPEVACDLPRRAVELSELGICGRLQPNLLKSRRRDLGVFP
jgi:hypothetical protein